MAKIKTYHIIIKGETHKVNINCTSGGLFRANLPNIVVDALNLNSSISNSTLDGLEDEINTAVNRYLNANTTKGLFIFIKYGASGSFAMKENGYALFGQSDKMYVRSEWSLLHNILGLDFKVCMKITVDGEVNWYDAKADVSDDFLTNSERIGDYCSTGSSSRTNGYKKIPYSETALDKLKFVSEQIRKASEVLHDFASQDDKAIEAFLNSDKMLMQ